MRRFGTGISAMYHELPRQFCPHRLGRNSKDQVRVLCYQYGGESETGPGPPGSSDNWPDIDAEDYPERDPQKGQRGSSPSR